MPNKELNKMDLIWTTIIKNKILIGRIYFYLKQLKTYCLAIYTVESMRTNIFLT